MATVSRILNSVKVNTGDKVIANIFGESFGLTANKEYPVLATTTSSVYVETDNGDKLWIPTEYFSI